MMDGKISAKSVICTSRMCKNANLADFERLLDAHLAETVNFGINIIFESYDLINR